MELSLDLSLVFMPKTITELLREVSMIKTSSLKFSKLDDYLKGLEDEMRKIDAFKRELPLCMLLLNDAIERLKEEALQCKELSDGSVMGEDGRVNLESDCSDKKNWLSSVQLWSNNSESQLKLRIEEGDRSVSENSMQIGKNGNSGGAFVPFKAESGGSARTEMKESQEVTQIHGLSLMTPITELRSCNSSLKSNGSGRVGSGSTLFTEQNQMKLQTKSQQQLQQQACRKQRRCWSPELHRRFVDALQQLGGSQVATPKQIRDLMQVDGLTNDEVKSHLQKYRLHIRKVPASPAAPANGLWMTQDQSRDNSKLNISQSGSPQGPLRASGSAKGTSSTGVDSIEAEEDEKSDGHSWKGGFHKPGEVDV